MIEVTVIGRGHLNGWLFCEFRRAGLVAKISAPPKIVLAAASAIDKNVLAKSLIPLIDFESQELFSRQAEKK